MDYSNKTILIVEDEDALQSAFKKGFESRGFRVLTADDGQEGIDIIRSSGPDIVILDLLMPNMNGEEVLEQMHAEGLTDKIAVFVVSNKSDGASLYKCKKLGAKEYLIKVNVSLDDIIAKIDEVFKE